MNRTAEAAQREELSQDHYSRLRLISVSHQQLSPIHSTPFLSDTKISAFTTVFGSFLESNINSRHISVLLQMSENLWSCEITLIAADLSA